jgi:hypothetical protein
MTVSGTVDDKLRERDRLPRLGARTRPPSTRCVTWQGLPVAITKAIGPNHDRYRENSILLVEERPPAKSSMCRIFCASRMRRSIEGARTGGMGGQALAEVG